MKKVMWILLYIVAFIVAFAVFFKVGMTVPASRYAASLKNDWNETIVNESTVPTLCAYGPQDKIVPVGIKFKLFDAFGKYNVQYDYLEFEHSGHAMMGDPEMQNKYVDMALDYCVRYFK